MDFTGFSLLEWLLNSNFWHHRHRRWPNTLLCFFSLLSLHLAKQDPSVGKAAWKTALTCWVLLSSLVTFSPYHHCLSTFTVVVVVFVVFCNILFGLSCCCFYQEGWSEQQYGILIRTILSEFDSKLLHKLQQRLFSAKVWKNNLMQNHYFSKAQIFFHIILK